MSRSPFFFIERPDIHTNKYELQHPIVWNWDHTAQITADLFPYNGNHDLFSIVEDRATENSFPTMKGIHTGLPKDCCDEIRKEFEECSYDTEWDGKTHHFTPTARWFTYADLYIYCLEHPEVPDWEAMDAAYFESEEDKPPKKIMKPTPLKSLKDRIDAFMEVMDSWDWENDYSQIRIVYWIF